MIFRDRFDAGARLAEKLKKYVKEKGAVLAVPRGGIPVGYVIARELGFPLEVILSKKIGHPANPEYAIGSVTLHGTTVNSNISGVPDAYIKKETERILVSLKEKSRIFTGERGAADVQGKTVILTDDGAATGYTLLASAEAIRKNNPARIIIAIPVAPLATSVKLRAACDELICLHTPEEFYGVGQFYFNFKQVSDEEAIRLFREANTGKKVA